MKRLYTIIAAALAVATTSAATFNAPTDAVELENLQLKKSILKTAAPAPSQCINFSTATSKARKAPKALKALKAPATAQEAFGFYQFQSQGILGEQTKLSLYVTPEFSIVRPEKEGNKVTVENFLIEGYDVTGTFDAATQTITIPSRQESTAKMPVVTLKDTVDYEGKPTKIDVLTYKEMSCCILPVDTASVIQDNFVLHLDSEARTLSFMETEPVPDQPGFFQFTQFLYFMGAQTAEDDLELYGLMRLSEGSEINADMSYVTLEDILNEGKPDEELIWEDHYNGVYAETNEDQSKLSITNLYGDCGGLFVGQLFDTFEFDIDLEKGTATLYDAVIYSEGTLRMLLWAPDPETGRPSDTVCTYKIANRTDKTTGMTFGVLYDNLAMALATPSMTIYNWFYAGQIILPFTWNFGNAGVEGVTVADENAPVEYFNLQGVPVANPENGLYIKRQGKTVTKVFVK